MRHCLEIIYVYLVVESMLHVHELGCVMLSGNQFIIINYYSTTINYT